MSSRDLIAAGLYLLPALLFTVIAYQLWVFRRHRRPLGRVFRLLPTFTTVLAAHYFLLAARALLPGAQPRGPSEMIETPWHALFEDPWLIVLALLRHVLHLLPLPERRPSAAWLAVNYGVAAVAIGTSLALRLHPSSTVDQQILAHRVFEIAFNVLGGLCFVAFVRNARPGRWGPEHAGEMRRPDVVIVQTGLLTAFLAVPIIWLLGGGEFSVVGFEVVLGFAFAAPMAARMLGHVVPEYVVAVGLFAATAGIFAVYSLALTRVDPSLHLLLGLGAVLAILALLTEGQARLRRTVTGLLLRRSQRRTQDLQAFLHTVSPELGVAACCRRVLAELVAVCQLPGAAIVFVDGEWLVHGDFRVEPLARVWPRGAGLLSLPAGNYGSAELRELPSALRDALIESNVGLAVSAIESPRRRWGHLFLESGFFGGMFRGDDADAFGAFVDQLGLLLDAADLLARALHGERSLAHAEKLAAIGELAARFAHDIRNPVTAARSLAQQLARDPAAPENAEHAAIILEELERVERQVRDLLRFARREEYRFEPVDLAALARATAAQLRPRCDAARVVIEVSAPEQLMATGDAEKLRHVLVNLLENAVDALDGTAGDRRVALAIGTENDSARLVVSDTGPGAPSDVMARLFEPFFSQKPNGTGLGLAIAKRTIEAHGGAITASRTPGAGLRFTIEVPLGAARVLPLASG